nr:hypothetical protein [Tanacetum cinerariifolium]
MSPENKSHFQAEKEAIFLLLTGIGYEIYFTVDACKTANEMWIAVERLQQGSDEDSDPEQAQKDKEMQNNFALIAKYFKNLYKPTNNNLRTYSNSRNKTVDNSPRSLGTLLRNAGSQSGLKTTHKEIDEHELEAHYSFVAKIQEDLPEDSNSNDTPLE